MFLNQPFLGVFGLFLLVIIPFLAQANIFQRIFDRDRHNEPAQLPNSQQMELLAPPLSPFNSIGGGDITIVDGALSAETGFSGSLFSEPGRKSVYTVKEGETLSEIAEMFGISTNTLRWSNDISGSTIRPGQILTILPVSGVSHIIKSGDTLQKIASQYKGDLEGIAFYNNISRDAKLAIGTEIIIPDGVIPAAAPSPKISTSVASRPSTETAAQVGYYIRPVVGGYRSQGLHSQNAVDIAVSFGTPIRAAANGVVDAICNGWCAGYGNFVLIAHPNGTKTRYAHNSKNLVIEGQQVSQGEIIAEVGSTGRSSGPHVHFEIVGRNAPRNPF